MFRDCSMPLLAYPVRLNQFPMEVMARWCIPSLSLNPDCWDYATDSGYKPTRGDDRSLPRRVLESCAAEFDRVGALTNGTQQALYLDAPADDPAMHVPASTRLSARRILTAGAPNLPVAVDEL